MATKWLLILATLTVIAGCGKENKTGRNGGVDPYMYSNPLVNGSFPAGSIINGAAVGMVGSVNLGAIIQQNPCVSGYGGYNQNQRLPIQIPLTRFSTALPANDVYVGVTSYGDVAAVIGMQGQPPMFMAYVCPRAFAPNGQGQLVSNPSIGSYSPKCGQVVKPIVAATLVFPGGASADFRMLDFGTSTGAPFSFCQPLSP